MFKQMLLKRHYFAIIVLALVVLVGWPNQPVKAADSSGAVVMVKTYGLASDGALSPIDYGSGVIIDNQGTVLTNYHVIAPDTGESLTATRVIAVCLTKVAGQEPECDYIASLLAFDADRDLALIRIKPVESNYVTVEPVAQLTSLSINPATTTLAIGAAVSALGYPAVGGNTLTVSKGTIIGLQTMNGDLWLKTDAMVSFGSSGGALVNSSGELIGLNSKIASDNGGSIGYALSASAFNDWIKNNMADWPQDSQLEDRLRHLLQVNLALTQALTYYNNDSKSLMITRATNWIFNLKSENELEISNSQDSTGGSIVIDQIKLPYRASRTAAAPLLKKFLDDNGLYGLALLTSDQPVTINGYQGRHLVFGNAQNSLDFYAFPLDNYFIFVAYSYGDNNQDKLDVDNMLNSLQLTANNQPVPALKNFSYAPANIKLKAGADWFFQTHQSEDNLLEMYNQKQLEAFGDLELQTYDGLPDQATNQQVLEYFKGNLNSAASSLAQLNLKLTIAKAVAKVSVNSKIKTAIQLDVVYRTADTGKIVAYQTNYYVPLAGKKFLTLTLTVYSDQKSVFTAAGKSFNQMLQSLSK